MNAVAILLIIGLAIYINHLILKNAAKRREIAQAIKEYKEIKYFEELEQILNINKIALPEDKT